MSNRISFFFTEALRSLTGNIATTISATISMLLALLLVGVFMIALMSARAEANRIGQDAGRVKVFLENSIADDQVNALKEKMTGMSEVKSVEYVSKDDALRRAKEIFKDNKSYLQDLPYNPFPASLEAELVDPEKVDIVANRMKNEDGVKKVDYGGRIAERVISFVNVGKIMILVLATLLVVSATVLVANTIRLSIFSRRREIEVMKLVGASNSFVRFPFMLEGLLCGIFAAVLAIGLIWGSGLFIGGVLHRVTGLEAQNTAEVFLLILGLAVTLGAVGSGLTIRKYLRV